MFFKVIKIISIIALITSFFCFNARAIEKEKIALINEFLPDPVGSDSDYEWIELHNRSNYAISLSNCFIDNILVTKEIVIDPNEFIVFAKDLIDNDLDNQSFEQMWGNNSKTWGDDESENFRAYNLNFSLSNSGEILKIDCPTFFDQVSYTNATEGKSFSLTSDGIWLFDLPLSPGKKNEQLVTESKKEDIIISEIYPSPNLTENEWIELYNNSNAEIDIKGFKITDNTSNFTFKTKLVINPKSYFVLEKENLNITLNNSGELISLFNANGIFVDSFEFKSTEKGISNIKEFISNEIFQTQFPTKGFQNEFVDLSNKFFNKKIVKINEARLEEIGSEIVIEGISTTSFDTVFKKSFFVEDNTGGIMIYVSDSACEIEQNRKTKLVGTISKYYLDKRIKVDNCSKIQQYEYEEFIPHELKVEKISADKINCYICFESDIVENSLNSFKVDLKGFQIIVDAKNTNNKDKSFVYIKACGIVTKTTSTKTPQNYKITILNDNEFKGYKLNEILPKTGAKVFFLNFKIL